MTARCSRCGSVKLRAASIEGLREMLLAIIGIFPFRCGDCKLRFRLRIWRFSNLFFSRCPRCHHMDLSMWSERYYNPPGWVRFKLALGARPWRCEYCRCNFASFRPRKERFSLEKRASRTTQCSDLSRDHLA